MIIKPADKGSCVADWDWEDYLAEADRHLKGNMQFVDEFQHAIQFDEFQTKPLWKFKIF